MPNPFDPTNNPGGPQPIPAQPPVAAKPTFVPSFLSGTYNINALNGETSFLNNAYFADYVTAEYIARHYGDGKVLVLPHPSEGGPILCSFPCYFFRDRLGRLTNAGIIADYFRRNPEKDFPGLADKMVRAVLAVVSPPDTQR